MEAQDLSLIKISELQDSNTINANTLIPITIDGTTKKIKYSTLLSAIRSVINVDIDEVDDKVDSVTTDVVGIENDITNINTNMTNLNNAIELMQSSVNSINETMQQTVEEVDALSDEIDATNNTVSNLSNTITSVANRVDAHNADTIVDITSYTDNNMYTFPSDGYIYISSGSSNSGYIRACLQIGNQRVFHYMNVSAGYTIFTIYVKKGIKYFTAANTVPTGEVKYVPMF